MVIYGINPVIEALRSGAAREIHVARRSDTRMREVVQLAVSGGVRVLQTTPEALLALAGTAQHQGVAARVEASTRSWTLDEVLALDGVPLLLVLDGLEDPQNVGAIIRTADAAGVTGIIRQERRSAALGPAAAKASAGALSHARIVDVVNIARAIADLKARGIWTVGLAGEAGDAYDGLDYRPPTAFVLGSEGEGLRRLIRQECDFLVRIPMRGHVSSLNVSVAAGVVLYEALRQRAAGGAPTRPSG
jgi:23S rRNA (guanosine2251-2'-O)-methyltransferase